MFVYSFNCSIVDFRQSVRSVLDRMTERTLLCLQEDEEEPTERADYAGAPPSKTSCDVAGTAGTQPARTDSVKSRLGKIRQIQDEFLQELARLDGQRAERLGRLQRRVEELEKLVYSIFGEESTREGVVVKKFVISSTRVVGAEEWENPRKEQPDEVNIIVLKDGINIEGLHVDGACDSKPIRVQQQGEGILTTSHITVSTCFPVCVPPTLFPSVFVSFSSAQHNKLRTIGSSLTVQ